MNEQRDNQGMQQQPNDTQRPQADQQNQQGNRRQAEGVEGTDQDGLDDGAGEGLDTDDLRPGRTGDGGAER
jgi:hypothetical protein